MSEASQFQNQIITALEANLIVSEDNTTTSAVDLYGTSALGIHVPTGFEGSEISFLGSYDRENYEPIYNPDGSLHKVTGITSSGGLFYLIANATAPWRQIKLVCGTAQTADRVFKVVPHLV